jgi:hypothetical protein
MVKPLAKADAVKSLIKDNPELADELEVKIKARIKKKVYKKKKSWPRPTFFL